MDYNFDESFRYENGFYLTATLERFSKFATHMDLYKRITYIPGEIVECGVFKGASLARFVKFRNLFENSVSRRVVEFDTFASFPPAEYELDKQERERLVASAGEQSITVEEMQNYLSRTVSTQNVELIAGDVRESIPEYLSHNPALRIALLHIDVDLYESTLACLKYLYPNVVRGGIIILDDYGAFAGANKAIEEYFSESSHTIKKLPYSYNISYIRKH